MAKWAKTEQPKLELEWSSTPKSPQQVLVLARSNAERPWLVDVVISGAGSGTIVVSLHRDDARILGYRLEEHDWHKPLVGWGEDGVEEPEPVTSA